MTKLNPSIMKKVFYLLVFWGVMAAAVHGQAVDSQPPFNLDFEKLEDGFPKYLQVFGSREYAVSVDSLIKYRGNHSVSISSPEVGTGFRALAFALPHSYDGQRITLSGYVRTEDVVEGWAGLWMRIDPSVGFDNMADRGITGTTEWTRYEISLVLDPRRTTAIVFGGILSGRGKMWVDDLAVSIDGVDIRDLEPIPAKVFPAEEDKEFDGGSGIGPVTLNPTKKDNLKLLGLIWGYLKYYHPAVGAGNYNWDYELFRILPEVLGATHEKERDEIFLRWAAGLGDFETAEKQGYQNVKMEPDLGWIETSFSSERLVEFLQKVRYAKREKDHYYIDLVPNVGNPIFSNENPYTSMRYPDAGFRILSLFRYWNFIQYYFPYKHLIEEDWKDVLAEFIPEFVNAGDETEYTLAALQLITRIHDTHANISGNQVLNNYLGSRYAPYEISFIEGKAVVTGIYQTEPATEPLLKTGDEIVSVNQKPVEDIIGEELVRTPGSNYPSRLLRIAENLLRTNDEKMEVVFKRDGVTREISLDTYPASSVGITNRQRREIPYFRMVTDRIGYIYPGTIKNEYLPAIWEEVKETDGLIIDLRCYPAEFIVFSLSEYLMPRTAEFVKFTTGSVIDPGYFVFTPAIGVGRTNPDHYKGQVVILVNEITLSQAEYTAMAFQQAPGALVLGSTTAGADGNVSLFSLPGGIHTMITGIGVYYPDGGETQRVGIVPDVMVKPTIDGIREGRDELMEAAIELIKGNRKGLD
jgi:C-terminal processing protease CtpA/Prc